MEKINNTWKYNPINTNWKNDGASLVTSLYRIEYGNSNIKEEVDKYINGINNLFSYLEGENLTKELSSLWDLRKNYLSTVIQEVKKIEVPKFNPEIAICSILEVYEMHPWMLKAKNGVSHASQLGDFLKKMDRGLGFLIDKNEIKLVCQLFDDSFLLGYNILKKNPNEFIFGCSDDYNYVKSSFQKKATYLDNILIQYESYKFED